MRYGIPLISLGILILILGAIPLPFHTTITVSRNFTLPPWITSVTITVNSGNFTIYTPNSEIQASKGYSGFFTSPFSIQGEGNVTITGDNIKLFYSNTYKYVSFFIIIVGIEIEIAQIIYNRIKKKKLNVLKRDKL
ncbi:hypothetical protein [Acidianus manzaensis]|uniref:Uncharacterized protein n=1 Tax=Acidianus manzaensis TaxID=282676 RepID=A0A1W6JYG5_9CREN|nr:hypothetical protein [Acidianus manzaensis]ARM75260.1 hypothetical protein B6F84_03920 [Acidianus manzaensis]